MLKKRVIPKLLLKNMFLGNRERPVIVTTRGFSGESIVGDPVSQAKIYESQMADELLLLDIEASKSGRRISLELVEKLAEELFMPFTVGGGVSTLEDFKLLLRGGADKICLCTSALEDPGLITKAANAFGRQCVVVCVDYREAEEGRSEVFARSGSMGKGISAVEWAAKAEELGAGEIILNSIDRDGSCRGLDLKTLQSAIGRLGVPVVASGGVGSSKHFIEGLSIEGASAVASGTYFAFKDENPIQTRAHIRNAGIPIR